MSVVYLGGEAMMTVVHLLNQSPTKSLQGKTPSEAWHGRTLAIGNLQTFSCLAYVKELNELGKFDDRSKFGVFISYAEGAKAYHILDPVSQRMRVACDVAFKEGRGWDRTKGGNDGTTPVATDFVIDYTWLGEHRVRPHRRPDHLL